MSNIGNTIYNGAVDLERGKSLIGALFATVIGLCICFLGIYMVTQKTTTTEATVKEVVCSVVEGKTVCNITIEYIVGVTNYTTTTSSPKSYSIGNKITITYDPENPQSVTLPNAVSNLAAGFGSMVCAIFLVVIGWGWWYVTNKYENVAAAQAVGDTLSILRR